MRVLAEVDADVLLITGLDYDAQGLTLAALADALARSGAPYLYQVPLRPNSGLATGFDIDGDGRLGGARDAMAYGRYFGEGGMAVLSRLPIDTKNIRDFSAFLWADLPRNLSPDTDSALRAQQRLSSNGHYELPLALPSGQTLRLLVYYATPPVFDGPEDRNGRRNHDETAFWLRLMAGELPFDAPKPPFVIMGQASLDPSDGEGRSEALRALLAHSMLQDPAPRGSHGRQEAGQSGDSALDTAIYPNIGGLRVSYILPSRDAQVIGAGVVWPADSDPHAITLATASQHRPVWVDVTLP